MCIRDRPYFRHSDCIENIGQWDRQKISKFGEELRENVPFDHRLRLPEVSDSGRDVARPEDFDWTGEGRRYVGGLQMVKFARDPIELLGHNVSDFLVRLAGE